MKRYSILAGLWLTIIVAIPGIAQAAPGEHYFNCKNCHLSGLSVTAMGGNNVCLRCHEEVGAYFPTLSADPPPAVDGVTVSRRSPGDASNHFGRNVETGSSGKETSHIWGVTDIWQAAGVPQAPSRTNYAGFYGRYNISTGKVTCSRCHNPHGETVVDVLNNATGLPTADLKDNTLMLNPDRADEDERNNVTGEDGPDGLPDIDIPDGIPDGDGIPDNPLANPQLLQRDGLNGNIPLTAEGVCRACHISFDIPNGPAQDGILTHPVVADYAAFQAANPDDYRTPVEIAAISTASKVSLVKVQKTGTAGVGCTSCHAAHYADSDSSTTDGAITRTNLSDSDGHLLRSDGPTRVDTVPTNRLKSDPSSTAQLRSNLCQSCHKYKLHSKNENGMAIGCLDCHGGHSYNGGAVSAYVLRQAPVGEVPVRPAIDADGWASVTYAQFSAAVSTRLSWADDEIGTANGFCEKCHGDVQSAPIVGDTANGEHSKGNATECTYCHLHNDLVYSFANDANAATCGTCHGFPPYKDISGNRATIGDANDGGWADNQTDYDPARVGYDQTTYFKDETITAHKTHAGAFLPINPDPVASGGGAGEFYFVGITGTDNCAPCHAMDAHREDAITTPALLGTTFRNITFNDEAKLGGGTDPSYNQVAATCSNVYCHSNGLPRTGDGPTRAVKTNHETPAWVGTGTNYTAGGFKSIFGQVPATRCSDCHGYTTATMTSRSNSSVHNAHLGAGTMGSTTAYACEVCHATTADSATPSTLKLNANNGKLGGTHVNGTIDVVYKTSGGTLYAALGINTLPGAPQDKALRDFNVNLGTCSIYCHDPLDTGLTADWDNTTDMQCDSCHGGLLSDSSGNGGSGPITTMSHTRHITLVGAARLSCDACHGANANIGTQTGHVDGIGTKSITSEGGKNDCSNIRCHSNGNIDGGTLVYKTVGVDYIWASPTAQGCDDCHGNGSGIAYPIYANGGVGNNSNSHAAHVGSGIACGECHATVSTNGTAIDGTIPTNHVNQSIDISGAKFTWVGGSETCNNITCHGGNSAQWGATALNCGSCHQTAGADVDNFVYGGGSPVTALISTAEWSFSGHGKTTGSYEVTGRAAANFPGLAGAGDPCKYCHDSGVTHNSANYFRLYQNGYADLNGNCLACHETGTTSFDPDGAGGLNAINVTPVVKIDKYHMGARHDGTHDGGRWCWDCHDPHGDVSALGARIQMVQKRAQVNPDANGVPASLTTTDIVFTNRTVGAGAGGFARTSAPYAAGICNACHTLTQNTDTTARYRNNAHTGTHATSVCTNCHKHSKDSTYDATAFAGAGTACNDCHANPPRVGDQRYASLGTTYGVHAKHSWVQIDDVSEDRSDCNICHPGAGTYPLDHSNGGPLNLAAGIQVLGGGNYSCGTLNSGLGCHLSDSNDGFWKDTADYGGNGLHCTACHNNGTNDGVLANAAPSTGAHTKHILATKTCADCHNNGVAITGTTHINEPSQPTLELDNVVLMDKAKADLGEGAVARSAMTFNQPVSTYTCVGNIALGCHNSKTAPNWRTATNIACTVCHVVTGSDTADPKSGLHNMTQANVQKHDSNITGGCTACHNSTKPSSHADGFWQVDQANNSESRFLNRSGLVYNDTGGPNMGTCFDSGASGAGSLDFAVTCHRDNGVWKRLWSQEADSTANTPGSARCKVCHGQYQNLQGNTGGGWNENTSHYLTFGGRSSVRGESHNSRVLGDNSACEDCHSYPSLANHENGSLNINDGGATNVLVDGAPSAVRCAACHAWGNPLTDGTFTFTPSAAFSLVTVTGSYDPIMQCNSCHGVGGSGRYWPVGNSSDLDNTAGRHEIHMERLAMKVYGETVAQLLTNTGQTSEVKQKNLCEYCHTAPAGFSGHHLESLPAEVVIANLWNKGADAGATYSSNQHGAGGADTCASVNCHNNKLTVDNSYGWYDATTGAGCIVCHTVGGTNDLPNHNIHPNSGLHNVTPTVSGVKHDDSFSVSGACGSCHTAFAAATVSFGGTHINGAASADGPSNTNAERGLFGAYTEGAVNAGTCSGTGVDNTSNCHADGGAWNRRWSTTASVNDGATECLNCHGTYAGWRTVRTNHVNPYTGGDQTPAHDAMGTAGEHPDCQICHGWGKAGYLTAWQNKTVGATPGHGDGRITMNGPAPSTGAGYNESTWGCAAACHSASWVMSDSGQIVNYGDYGGGSCDTCHGVAGTGQYWPDGTPAAPSYADDNVNSAARHATHLTTIAQYKWGMTLTQLKANDANQKAACAFCHPSPGANGHNSDGGLDQRVDVAGAGAFRKFTGSTNDAADSGSGAYASATRSCSNLVCHNLVTTPTVAADAWEGTTAANCTTLCHGPNVTATAREGHQKHVVTKGYACTQCHPNNGTNYQHINGTVTLNFLVSGSLEQTYGSGTVASYSDGSFAFDRTNPTGNCTNIYCHVDKQTPAWNATINTSTTGCVDCHTVGGAGSNPTSGLHNVTPSVSGKQHSSGFSFNAGANTAYCSTCHTTQPTVNGADHVNGVFSSTVGAAGNTVINFAGPVGFSDGTTPTCNASLTGCHLDGGDWARKWSTSAANSDGSECANCHGGIGVGHTAGGWVSGIAPDHTIDRDGDFTPEVMTSHSVCKTCHGFAGSANKDDNYVLTNLWNQGGPDTSMHGNSQITMNGGAGYNSTNFGCDSAGCHGNASTGRALTDSGWTVQLASFDVGGDCWTCHGNGSNQSWPDGLTYPDRAGSHIQHIPEIATKMPGGNTLANRNATCDYCHPNPGGDGHATDGVGAELLGDGLFRYIIDGTTNGSGMYNYDTDGTCSTLKCHARAPYTPGWYGDTQAPGNVTLYAELGPVPRSIRLYWDAPGDDGFIDGTAYKYDIRMSKNDSGAGAINFVSTTNYVQGIPTVKRKGDTGNALDDQQAIIHNVDPSANYYFALRTYDEVGNYGGTANGGGYVQFITPAAAVLDNKPPVLTGSPSWYGLDSAKAMDAPGTVKLSWTRAEDHSMPITYDIWWSTGNITYGTPQASTGDTSYRVTGLTNGETYNFAVRARDAAPYNNTDTNTIVLQAVPQGLSAVPKTDTSYYANGTATSNIPMQAALHTVNGTTTSYPAVFIGPVNFTKDTNIFANSFSIYVDNSNVASTLRAELGYITGTNTWNSFSAVAAGQTDLFATDQTVAKRAIRLVTFKFNGAQRLMKATMNGKLAVRVSVSGGAIDSLGWGPTSKGGILNFLAQPVNQSPTVPSVTYNTTNDHRVSFYWTAADDSADGVADTVHYDVYGDDGIVSPGTFPYLIASGLTTNATSGAPLVWDTQAAGIVSSSNVKVKVEAGDVINGKVLSHTPSVPVNRTINNSGDNVAPGAVTDFKAETRPKQGSVYLTWTAPGDDGGNNGRAVSYDIRYAATVIDDDTKYNAATQLVSEPYPDFGGNGQGYEVLSLPDGNYYFAIKALDDATPTAKASPLAYTTAATATGPKCGICHATPPNEWNAAGNHAKHGYTMNDCSNCHGNDAVLGAQHFATNHQDGVVKLGWKTANPQAGSVAADDTITYTQGAELIYSDDSGGGFNVELDDLDGDLIDNGTCSGWSNLQVSGCHGSATNVSWDAAATLACNSCHGDPSRTLDKWGHSFDDTSADVKASPPVDNHGYDPLITEPVEGKRSFVGAHVAHLNYSFRLSKGDSCRLCHGASRPGNSLHADGNIDVKLDLAAAGPSATWTDGNLNPDINLRTAGSCASMSPESCHPTAGGPIPLPKWDAAQTFTCNMCHGFGGTTPGHVTDPLGSGFADDGHGNCTWCHVGGHPKEKKVTAITKASPALVTTENDHHLTTGAKVTIHTQVGMTEINNKTFTVTVTGAKTFQIVGSNTSAYTTFTTGTWIEGNGYGVILLPNDSRSGINYTSGGVHLKANIAGRGEMSSEAELCWSCHVPNGISEWGADNGPTNVYTRAGITNNNYNYGTLSTQATTGNWVGAIWNSAVTGTSGFGYKSGVIRSTHSTDPTGTSALTGSFYNYSNGGVDTVGKIHCSYCHDVHDSTNSPLEADGLNPDGPPYLRGTWKSNPYKEDGAPWAGQSYIAETTADAPGWGYGALPRSNSRTDQAMGGYWIDQNSGNPTAGWSYASSAGLCQLCHGDNVDTLDVAANGNENLWIGAANGHINSTLGGSGTGGTNIFFNGAGGRNGDGGRTTAPNYGAYMGFENSLVVDAAKGYAYGPRSGRNAYMNPRVADPTTLKLTFAWGNTVDASTPEVGYHQFSCSKCHNPHASRLPKLLITNCLDVSHNTWDTGYDNENTWTSWTSNAWNTQKLSHMSTAQNCHRFVDVNGDNTPDEKGWNKVTPW